MPTLVFLSAFGAWLGMANPVYQIPLLVLLFPAGLCWIAFRAYSGKRAFLWGWLAGTLACTGCLYWMVVPVAVYGNLPWFIALPCPPLAGAALGLFYALFCLLMFRAARRFDSVLLCVFAGVFWIALEQLISVLFSGFPWINISSAFVDWPWMTQLASMVGAYGLSGILAAMSCSILLYSTLRWAKLFAAGLAVVVLGYGFYAVSLGHPQGKDVTLGLVQGNVDQSLKWNPEYQTKTVTTYLTLSRDAILADHPALVVWPETAMPFYFQDDTPYGRGVRKFADRSNTPIMTGAPAYKVTDPATRKYVLYNRAFLVDADGKDAGAYDKEHLVPFGEYMPLKKFLPFEQLVQAAGNFVPGQNDNPLYVDGNRFGVLVCYEAIFPALAQKQVANGAQFLVNISNDAWFGKTSAPKQHLALTRMRAIEQGRWIARSTNTGITCFIDPQGRVDSAAPQFVPAYLNGHVQALDSFTVYHIVAPWLSVAVYLASAVGLLLIIISPSARGRRLLKKNLQD